jgi:hypothetical protein
MAFWSILEIEIEGRTGWSERSQTWYRFNGWPAHIYRKLTGDKPLTGYHCAMNGINITTAYWVTGSFWLTVSLWLAFATIEDFVWFVLNHHYGIGKFKQNTVWWHSKSKWLLGLFPIDYLVGLTASTVTAVALQLPEMVNVWSATQRHLLFLVKLLACVFVTIIIAPLYRNWRIHMAEHDERSEIDQYFPDHKTF